MGVCVTEPLSFFLLLSLLVLGLMFAVVALPHFNIHMDVFISFAHRIILFVGLDAGAVFVGTCFIIYKTAAVNYELDLHKGLLRGKELELQQLGGRRSPSPPSHGRSLTFSDVA